MTPGKESKTKHIIFTENVDKKLGKYLSETTCA
jgi:hypothetical protein